MPNRVCVTSADFIRNIGYWQNEAIRHPIHITHHGRPRLILSAADGATTAEPANDAVVLTALSKAHGLSATLLDQSHEGFLSFDEHLHVIAANRVADGFFAKSRDDIVGASLAELLPSLAANTWTSHFKRVQRSRQSEFFDSQVHQFHIRLNVFPLDDSVGVLFLNITEEVRLRVACESADAQSAALAGFDELCSVQVDAQGRVEFADESFCETLSFANHDLKGHRLADIVAVANRRAVHDALERVLRGGERLRLTTALISKGGAEIPLEVSIAPITSDHAVTGALLLCMTRSATVRRGAEVQKPDES